MKRLMLLGCSVLLLSVAASNSAAQGPSPVMDYTSVLNSLDVYHNGGRFQLDFQKKLFAAFLPENGAKVHAVLTKKGSTQPVHVQEFYVQKWYGKFFEISSRGKYKEYKFTEPGEYVVTYFANDKPMTAVPFTVVVEQGGDDFNPVTCYYLDGPWNDLAQIAFPLDDADSKPPQFVTWLRKKSFEEGAKADEYFITVRKDGDVISDFGTTHVGSQEWLRVQEDFRHPEHKGGLPMRQSELLGRDGTYDVIVKLGDQLHAVYQFEIKNGKPVPHERQNSKFKPRTEYLTPRFAGDDNQAGLAANITWMNRVSDAEAKRIAEGGPAVVAGPSEDSKRKWQWTPSADPKRPFELVVTDIETRADTTIRVGDDLIAFGTGYPTGVQYMLVGDTQPREIPHGETYDAMVFQVCGRKIILVKKNQIVVFDSDTEKLTPIPQSEVSLYNVAGGNHRPNLVNADGNLVAVVNKTVSVDDRNTIKVIDVSGDEPKIIPIKNGSYNDRQVSSVAVDAKQGIVAISSREKKAVYLANVAPLANQREFSLGDYKGIGNRQVFIADEGIVYADETDRVRHLSLDGSAPRAIVDEPIGRSGNGYTHRKGRIVLSTAEKFGTRFEMAMSDLPDKPMTLAKTGEKIEGTSAALGMAGCAAITHEKTVFLAGTPSGGIGKGERLQILDKQNNSWLPVFNDEGNVVTATDVVASIGLVAFKSADRNRKVTIGYATFGDRIDTSQVPTKPSPTDDDKNAAKEKDKTESTEGSPYYTKNQLELDLIVEYVKTEKETATALGEAFGAEAGAKKARTAILDVMKKNGHEHLIPGFLKMMEDDQ